MTKDTKIYSFNKMFIRTFSVIFALMFLLLIVYMGIASAFFTKQTNETVASTLKLYNYSLQMAINATTTYQKELAYNNTEFQLLSIEKLSTASRLNVEQDIRTLLESHVSTNEYIAVTSDNDKVSMYVSGPGYTSVEQSTMHDYKEHLEDLYHQKNGDYRYLIWNTVYFNDCYYIVYATTNNGLTIYSSYELDKLDLFAAAHDSESPCTLTFWNDRDGIIANSKTIEALGITKADLENPKNSIFKKYYILSAPVPNTDIHMSCIFENRYSMLYARVAIALIILLIVGLLGAAGMMLVKIREIILYPLTQINSVTQRLKDGTLDTSTPTDATNILEFRQINEAIIDLVNQKNRIHSQMEQESFEKDRARLQYFQLQTRSHFIINCLKSLNGMLDTKDYKKMKRMIIAFSNHLRYIFHDNLKLVTLEEELAEVNDYFNIIIMDRATPVILNRQVPEEFLDCKVPSLLIQTFLENTLKYNKASETLLIFDIKIVATTLNGCNAMQILLGDNGIGYSEEYLKVLNDSNSEIYADKHVGIENLKHRIEILYKNNYELAFYNGPNGGAKAIITIPLSSEFEPVLEESVTK